MKTLIFAGSTRQNSFNRRLANVAAIMAQPDVDGALVGGASIDAVEFASICRYRSHVGTHSSSG